ncbi:RNA polymerase sigma factor SigF [Streptomyces sp. NPDC090052]|uniref:RNA polymerase sigma factor SigF n=1 Tax=unclassified Streptomyces TaxID=2593676 RepID=UPI003812BEA3
MPLATTVPAGFAPHAGHQPVGHPQAGHPPGRAPGQLPYVAYPSKVASYEARELSRLFFATLDTAEEGTHEHQYARNTLIELNLSLVRFAATRFRSRSDQMEDIVQVGTIGLIKAIDRFDLSREVEFATFAMPCIIGEIKRFFRDTSWSVHVPRRLQEMRITLAKASDELFQTLDRSPTPAELARHLGMDEEEIVEGLVAANGYTAGSIDSTVEDGADSGARTLADRLGEPDSGLDLVENLAVLKPLVARLGARDRRILRMRYGDELTQSQIGAELGISQMHVSRLLARITAQLRRELLGPE